MMHNGITADWIRRDQGVTRATLHAAVAALNLIVFVVVAITKRSMLVLMKESSEEKEESRVNVSEGG